MTIRLDGYKVRRTQRLEDLTTGLGTSLSALAEQVWTENPMSSIFRLSKLNQELIVEPTELEKQLLDVFRSGTKLEKFKGPKTPVLNKQDADKKVSEAGVKLDIGERGIPEGALDIMIERKREEIKRKALIAAAPEGFWSGAAQIGTGLAVSVADPINVASAFIPIVGQARYAKLIAGTATAVGRTSVRAGVGVTEGLVGAALVEPVILLAAEAEQADYGLYDSFLNLTCGAVLGGALHAGLGAIGDAVGRSAPQTKEDLIRSAVGQAMDNKAIDVGFVARTNISFMDEWHGLQIDELKDKAVSSEIDIIKSELLPIAGNKLSKGEIKDLTFELNDLEFKAKNLESESVNIKKQGGQRLKKQGIKKGERIREIDSDLQGLKEKVDIINEKLKANNVASKASSDLSRIEQGIIPDDFKTRVADVADAAVRLDVIKPFEAKAPNLDAKSPEASDLSSRQAQETLDTTADFTPESVDSLTDDILTALDEQEIDTASVRKEIDEINQTAKRDENGLREAIACMLGK